MNPAGTSTPTRIPKALLLFCGCVAVTFAIAANLTPRVEAAGKHEMQIQGAALFAGKGCAHCHGEAGFGGSDSGPDLSRVRKELKAAEIAQQIHDGGNNMPPFGEALTGDEIASLVEYLRSKRHPPAGYQPHAPTVAAPPAPTKSDPD